jgi:replicative superfamily II helicase
MKLDWLLSTNFIWLARKGEDSFWSSACKFQFKCVTLVLFRTKVLLTQPAQIVGMSATLSSIDRMKTFLRAHLFSTNFRPVQLEESIKVDEKIHRYDSRTGDFHYSKICKRIVRCFI